MIGSSFVWHILAGALAADIAIFLILTISWGDTGGGVSLCMMVT